MDYKEKKELADLQMKFTSMLIESQKEMIDINDDIQNDRQISTEKLAQALIGLSLNVTEVSVIVAKLCANEIKR